MPISDDFIPRFPPVVDATMLACYDACPTKFWYEYVNCISGLAVSPDLHAGGAMARGFEVTRKAFYLHKMPPTTALTKGIKAFFRFWGDFEPPPDGFGRTHAKDFINTGDALLDYFREYPLETDPIQPYIMTGDIPAIEFTFALPLPIIHPESGDPILYGGRLDMLGYYKNFLAVIDEKTTKSIQSNITRTCSMRGQFLGYIWAAQQMGIPVTAAIIRYIAIQKTQTKHVQHLMQVSEGHIEKWHGNMLKRVQRMVDDYQKGEWELSFGDACGSYGGCSFLDLCTSRQPEAWFDTYQRRIWNPLFRNPTDPDERGLRAT